MDSGCQRREDGDNRKERMMETVGGVRRKYRPARLMERRRKFKRKWDGRDEMPEKEQEIKKRGWVGTTACLVYRAWIKSSLIQRQRLSFLFSEHRSHRARGRGGGRWRSREKKRGRTECQTGAQKHSEVQEKKNNISWVYFVMFLAF